METMLDVKKLITGFLILALGASTAAWILSGTQSAAFVAPPAQTAGTLPSSAPSSSAFLPSDVTPQDVVALLASQPSSTETALEKPGNLTGMLGNSLINELVAENPNGIQTDTNNDQVVNQPDDNAILAELQGNPATSNISIPNWNTEAAKVPIRTIKSTSETDVAAYSNAIDNAFGNYFVQNGVQNMVSDTAGADPSNVNYVQSAVQGALNSIASTETPFNLQNFQKSLIKLLVYEKNVLSLAGNSNTDPIKTSLILQGEESKYNLVLNEFSNQLQQAQSLDGFSLGKTAGHGPQASAFAFLNTLFGIPTAHAFLGIGDVGVTFDPAVFGRLVLQYGYNIVLQIAKNALISFMQNRVLHWIKGGTSGLPMFIQNWAYDLTNAVELSAINAINSNFTCINNNTIYPQIEVVLNAIYKPGNNVCAAQFASQLSSDNLQQFYNNFANGGFVTFGETLMPSNNFYGGLFFAAQSAGQAAQQGQTLFTVKATAQQGFNGVERCDDGSNPSGISSWCSPPTGSTGLSVAPVNADGTCNTGWTKESAANNGKCADGTDPITNTPGQVTGQMFQTSVQGSTLLVTAANDITGLLNAAVDSLLNSLANLAITSAGTAIDKSGITGLTLPTTPPAGSIPPELQGIPSNHSANCFPVTQDITFDSITGQSAVTLYAEGGALDTKNNPPTYTWSAPSSTLSGGGTTQGSFFQAVYNAPGIYNVSVVASTDNSSSTCQVVLQSSSTTIPQPPQTPVGASGVNCEPATQDVTFAAPSSSVTFSVTSTAASANGNPIVYTWSAPSSTATSGNTTLPGAFFQATYSARGTYNVFVTASTGTGTSTCTTFLQ
jgi:PKD domain-containing protein